MIGIKVLIFVVGLTLVASKSVVELSEVGTNDISVDLENSIFAKNEKVFKKDFKNILSSQRVKDAIGQLLFDIFSDSIGKKCANQKTNKLNFSSDFLAYINGAEGEEKEKITSAVVYISVGLMCSNKVRPFKEFVFDAVMSVGHLVRAFVNEPLLEDYMLYLRCANKYAVDNNIWDNSTYPVNTRLSEDEHFVCDMSLSEIKELIKDQEINSKIGQSKFGNLDKIEECNKKAQEETMKFWLRTVLLTQVELTAEARETEKQKYIAQSDELTEEGFNCLSQMFE